MGHDCGSTPRPSNTYALNAAHLCVVHAVDRYVFICFMFLSSGGWVKQFTLTAFVLMCRVSIELGHTNTNNGAAVASCRHLRRPWHRHRKLPRPTAVVTTSVRAATVSYQRMIMSASPVPHLRVSCGGDGNPESPLSGLQVPGYTKKPVRYGKGIATSIAIHGDIKRAHVGHVGVVVRLFCCVGGAQAVSFVCYVRFVFSLF